MHCLDLLICSSLHENIDICVLYICEKQVSSLILLYDYAFRMRAVTAYLIIIHNLKLASFVLASLLKGRFSLGLLLGDFGRGQIRVLDHIYGLSIVLSRSRITVSLLMFIIWTDLCNERALNYLPHVDSDDLLSLLDITALQEHVQPQDLPLEVFYLDKHKEEDDHRYECHADTHKQNNQQRVRGHFALELYDFDEVS